MECHTGGHLEGATDSIIIVHLRHVLQLISSVFKNSNAQPLYSDTVPLILLLHRIEF